MPEQAALGASCLALGLAFAAIVRSWKRSPGAQASAIAALEARVQSLERAQAVQQLSLLQPASVLQLQDAETSEADAGGAGDALAVQSLSTQLDMVLAMVSTSQALQAKTQKQSEALGSKLDIVQASISARQQRAPAPLLPSSQVSTAPADSRPSASFLRPPGRTKRCIVLASRHSGKGIGVCAFYSKQMLGAKRLTLPHGRLGANTGLKELEAIRIVFEQFLLGKEGQCFRGAQVFWHRSTTWDLGPSLKPAKYSPDVQAALLRLRALQAQAVQQLGLQLHWRRQPSSSAVMQLAAALMEDRQDGSGFQDLEVAALKGFMGLAR